MFAPPAHLKKKRAAKVIDPYVAGAQHARRGDHERAIHFFTLIIDSGRGSGSAAVYAARGASAQALGNHVRAVYDFSMAIRLEPGVPSHLTSRAVSFAALNQLETKPGALLDHDAAVMLVQRQEPPPPPPQLAGVHLARGLAREAAGKYEGAVEDLTVALGALRAGDDGDGDGDSDNGADAEKPEVGGALVKRGACLRQLGRLEEALADLREAVSHEPRIAHYKVQLSRALRDAGDQTGAEAQLADAARLRPDDPSVRLEHGTALWECGRADAAADAVKAALELAPSEPSVHLAHAQHLHRVAVAATGPMRTRAMEAAALAFGDAERIALLKRQATLARVAKANDEESRASRTGRPLPLASQADKSEASLAAASLASTAADAAHGAGLAFASLSRIDEALARFEAALELLPDRAETRLQLAMALYAVGRQHQALVELEHCTRLRPGWAAPHRLRGELYRERGELGPSAEEFGLAMGCPDGVVDDRVRRGGVRMLLGSPHEAAQDFAAAIEQGAASGPSTVKLHVAYAAALRATGQRKRALLELGAALRHASGSLALPYAEEGGDASASSGGAEGVGGRGTWERKGGPSTRDSTRDGGGDDGESDDDGEEDDDEEEKEADGQSEDVGGGGTAGRRGRHPGAQVDDNEQRAFERSENARVRAEHDALVAAVHAMRGQCLHERRQYAAAIRAFDHAVRLTPDDGYPRALRAASYYRSGRLNHAISDAREALKPGALSASASDLRADTQQLLGMLLARSEQPWNALAALSACIHLQQDAVEEHLARVKADEEQQTQASKGAPLRSLTPGHRPAPSISAGQPPRQQQHRSAPTLGLEGRDRPATGSSQPATHRPAPSIGGGGWTGAAAGQTAGQRGQRTAPVHRRQPPPPPAGAPAAASSRERGQRRLRRPPQPQPSSPAVPAPPTTCHALAQRALVLLLCERPEAAEEDLNLTLRLRPGWDRAHFLRGFARKSRGAFDAAASDFHMASASGSADLAVDFKEVFHKTLGPEALLDEAGWHPMPSVFTMASAGEVLGEGGGGGEEEEEVDDDAEVAFQMGGGALSTDVETDDEVGRNVWAVAPPSPQRSKSPASGRRQEIARNDQASEEESGEDEANDMDDEDGEDFTQNRQKSLGGRLASSASDPRFQLEVRKKAPMTRPGSAAPGGVRFRRFAKAS